MSVGLVQSLVFMHNGKIYDDKFYELFSEKAPVKKIIKLAVDWNAEKQLDHFSQLYHHINNKDEFAKYAESVVNGTREVLQRSLQQVGYKKEMTLEQYLLGRYQIQNSLRSEVNPDVLEGIQLLDKIPGDEFEKILDEGQREEINWELDNLHPYTIVPNSPKTPESVPESQTDDKAPAAELQGAEDIASQLQETTEKPNEDLQQSEQQIPTPQESGEQIPTSQESVEQIPTPQESAESLPEEQITQTQDSNPSSPVDEAEEKLQESAQEDQAEPLKSEEVTSEPQNSEETQVDSQESQES